MKSSERHENAGATTTGPDELTGHASMIVCAYVSKNPVPAHEVPTLIKSVHSTLQSLGSVGADAVAGKPMVPISRSIAPDYIVCLEDGKKLKMLKRYLRSHFNLTPEEYRAKWKLPVDYPMVAPNYSRTRSDFAKKIGLGRTKPTGRSKRR